MSTCPSLCWDLVQCETGGPVCSVTVSVSSYMHPSCCIWMTLSAWSQPPPLVPTVCPLPLLHRLLSLEGRDLIQTSHSPYIVLSILNSCATVPKQFHCLRTSMTIFGPVSYSSSSPDCNFPEIRIIFQILFISVYEDRLNKPLKIM